MVHFRFLFSKHYLSPQTFLDKLFYDGQTYQYWSRNLEIHVGKCAMAIIISRCIINSILLSEENGNVINEILSVKQDTVQHFFFNLVEPLTIESDHFVHDEFCAHCNGGVPLEFTIYGIVSPHMCPSPDWWTTLHTISVSQISKKVL